MTVAEVTNVRVTVAWQNENEALVYVAPVNKTILVGALHFEVEDDHPNRVGSAQWFFIPTMDEGDNWEDSRYIDVDPAAEQRFRDERVRILGLARAQHPALLAELDGRIEMHRNEHRDVATLGAKIEGRKWWRELQDWDLDPQTPDSSSQIAPAQYDVQGNLLDVANADVKARRNYKQMKPDKLIDTYRQLVRGHGDARRRTLDWRADIPFVEQIIREKGLDTGPQPLL